MRILIVAIGSLLITACGPAVFGGDSAQSKASNEASGVVNQGASAETIAMCASVGMVPKQGCDSDSSSTSSDDDSVDGISADGISSDDDSSDDAACSANQAACIAKKCQAPPAAPVEPTPPAAP